MRKPLKYYLRQNDSTYYVVSGGVVTTAAYDNAGPDGTLRDASGNNLNIDDVVSWDEFEISQKRGDHLRLGVFRKYGPEKVRMAGDMATVLRTLFAANLSESTCQLEVHYHNHATMQYELLQVADCDFSQYTSAPFDDFVDIALCEVGTAARLMANMDTTYSIPISESDCSWVKMDGVNIKGSYHFIVFSSNNNATIVINQYSANGIGNKAALAFGAYYRNKEGQFDVLATNNQVNNTDIGFNGASGGIFTSAYLFIPVVDAVAELSGKMEFYYRNNLGGSEKQLFELVMAEHKTPDFLNLVSETVLWTDPSGLLNIGDDRTGIFDTTVSGNVSVTLSSSKFYLFYFRITPEHPESTPTGSTVRYSISNDGFFHIDYDYTQPATSVRAYTHNDLMTKLFNLAGINAYSDYLSIGEGASRNFDLNPANTYMTCGDAIRGLYLDADGNPKDPEIKTSIKEFLQDLFARCGATLGIDENDHVKIEQIEYFFDGATEIANLGTDFTDIEFSPMNTYSANVFDLGYKKQSYDDVNGRYEYNQGQQYKNQSLRTPKKADYTTPYRFDCYGIEFTRANLSNKKSTDSGSDNDTFGIVCDGTTISFDGHTCQVIDRNHTITAGIPTGIDATVYNIACTPHRNLMRLGRWLASTMFNAPDPAVSFTTGEKNTGLISEMYYGPITEVDPLAVSDYTPYFYPVSIRFTSTADISLAAATAGAAKYGYVKIKYNGQYINGFVWGGIGIHPGSENVYKYDLLWATSSPLLTEL